MNMLKANSIGVWAILRLTPSYRRYYNKIDIAHFNDRTYRISEIELTANWYAFLEWESHGNDLHVAYKELFSIDYFCGT